MHEHQTGPETHVYCISVCVWAHTRVCPCADLRLLSCLDLRICIWFGRSSEIDRFSDTEDGVQSTMLALRLLELLFSLLINHSIPDKTSNCFNVASVSMLTLAVWWFLRAEKTHKPRCGFNLENGPCETSKKIKASIMPDPSLRQGGEIFPQPFIAAFL